MKKLMIAVLMMLAVAVYAQDDVEEGDKPAVPEAPAAVEIRGQVAVVKDNAGAVTQVKITTAEKEVYIVKQDAEGKKVAALNGKQVVVTGVVDQKTKTVTVEDCQEVEEEVGG